MRDESQLVEWASHWQGLRPDPAASTTDQTDEASELLEKVQRRTRLLAALTLAEVAFVSGVAGWLVLLAHASPSALEATLFVSLGLLAGAALACSLVSRERDLRARADTGTTDYLRYLLRRCDRRLLEIKAGWALLALEAILLTSWLLERSAREPTLLLTGLALLAALCAFAAAGLHLVAGKIRFERAGYSSLLRELDEEPSDLGGSGR